ncbi:MAG: hypothetical protein C0609_08365 [Deltaproteobacteria bacterium]|nr:MAG: hypothetical protein C0609_08365 [Deltaproteobacteria bacterium]
MPQIGRSDIEQALRYFDEVHRISPKFEGWEKNPEYVYAIEHNRVLYPLHQIFLYIATRVPGVFRNDEDMARKLNAMGFTVTHLEQSASLSRPPNLPASFIAMSEGINTLKRNGAFPGDATLTRIVSGIEQILQEGGIFTIYQTGLIFSAGDGDKWNDCALLTISLKRDDGRTAPMRCNWALFPENERLVLSVEMDFDDVKAPEIRDEALESISQGVARIRLLCQEMAAERSFDLGEPADSLLPAEDRDLRRAATVVNKVYKLSSLPEEQELIKDLILMLDLARDYGEMAEEAHSAASGKESKAQEEDAGGKVITDVNELFDELEERDGPLDRLAESIGVDSNYLERAASLLSIHGQLALLGPSGCMKREIARGLALVLAGEIQRVKRHPLFPGGDNALMEFERFNKNGEVEVADGPLKTMAIRATADPGKSYFLVVEGIEHCGIVGLGEGYFMLPNRGESFQLERSGEFLTLPPNLKVIATGALETDQELFSIFPVMRLMPSYPPIEGVFQRWLEDNAPELSHLADMLEEVNDLLQPEERFGPAAFMTGDINESHVELRWDHMLLPMLAAKIDDEPEKLAPLSYQKLKAKVTGNG